MQDRKPRGRIDRMREQVQRASSFRDSVDLTLPDRTCTCTAYGAGLWNDTAETTEIEFPRSTRSLARLPPRRVFIPFSAVSVACFDPAVREVNSQEFISSVLSLALSVVSEWSRKAFPVK